ncbi:MAG TPA: sortase [Candidatus Paceibacterota bacterium]|nr:sortase [Candidatus Paceibacterota bacterium]
MNVNSLSELTDAVLARKVSFLVVFFMVFLFSYAILSWLDILPELVEKPEENESALTIEIEEPVVPAVVPPVVKPEPVNPVYPTNLYIAALDRNITVLNPTSRNINDLDAALLRGAVRHPDSATLERAGTVFILGHSSYLPVVRNKAFQAFNDIQKLKWGDLIEVTTAEGLYIYRVDKVYRANAQDVTVPIAGQEKRLFLATCNSFGSIDDRYIVEAELLETKLY